MSLGTTIHSAWAETDRPVQALVLMGGGARTAYQVGVLKALGSMLRLQARAQDQFPFQVLVGTSAGAINAAYLASTAVDGIAAFDSLGAFWARLRSRDVYALQLSPWVRFSRLVAAVQPVGTRAARGRGAGHHAAGGHPAPRHRAGRHRAGAGPGRAADRGHHRLQLHHRRPLDLLPQRARPLARALEPAGAPRRLPAAHHRTPDGLQRDPVPVSGHAAVGRRPARVLRRRLDAAGVAAVAGDAPGRAPGAGGGRGPARARRAGRRRPRRRAGHGRHRRPRDGQRVPRHAAGRRGTGAARHPHAANSCRARWPRCCPIAACEVLALQPSQSLDALAQAHVHELPAGVRRALGGLAARQGAAAPSRATCCSSPVSSAR